MTGRTGRWLVAGALTLMLGLAAAHTAAQQPASTQPPAGWTSREAPAGRVAAMLHAESLAYAEVSRLDIDAQDAEAAANDVAERLGKNGLHLSGKPFAARVGSKNATARRFTALILDENFTVMVVDLPHEGKLWQLTVTYKPTTDTTAQDIEKGALEFFAALTR